MKIFGYKTGIVAALLLFAIGNVHAQPAGRISNPSGRTNTDYCNLDFQKGGLFYGFDPETEQVKARNATSKTFRTSNGHFSTVLTAVPINYQDAQGQWKSIDRNIRPNTSGKHSEYAYANTANSFQTFYANRADKELRTDFASGSVVEGLNKKMVWLDVDYNIISSVKINNATAAVSADHIIYGNVFTNVDMMYAQQNDGRKMNYVLKSASTISSKPENAAYLAFAEDIQLPTNWTIRLQRPGFDEANFYTIHDQMGEIVCSYPAPTHTDAKGNEIITSHILKGNTLYTIVPVEWLQSSVFPVTIDPTVTIPTDGVGAVEVYQYDPTKTKNCTSTVGTGTISLKDGSEGNERTAGVLLTFPMGLPGCTQIDTAHMHARFGGNANVTINGTVKYNLKDPASASCTEIENGEMVQYYHNNVNGSSSGINIPLPEAVQQQFEAYIKKENGEINPFLIFRTTSGTVTLYKAGLTVTLEYHLPCPTFDVVNCDAVSDDGVLIGWTDDLCDKVQYKLIYGKQSVGFTDTTESLSYPIQSFGFSGWEPNTYYKVKLGIAAEGLDLQVCTEEITILTDPECVKPPVTTNNVSVCVSDERATLVYDADTLAASCPGGHWQFAWRTFEDFGFGLEPIYYSHGDWVPDNEDAEWRDSLWALTLTWSKADKEYLPEVKNYSPIARCPDPTCDKSCYRDYDENCVLTISEDAQDTIIAPNYKCDDDVRLEVRVKNENKTACKDWEYAWYNGSYYWNTATSEFDLSAETYYTTTNIINVKQKIAGDVVYKVKTRCASSLACRGEATKRVMRITKPKLGDITTNMPDYACIDTSDVKKFTFTVQDTATVGGMNNNGSAYNCTYTWSYTGTIFKGKDTTETALNGLSSNYKMSPSTTGTIRVYATNQCGTSTPNPQVKEVTFKPRALKTDMPLAVDYPGCFEVGEEAKIHISTGHQAGTTFRLYNDAELADLFKTITPGTGEVYLSVGTVTKEQERYTTYYVTMENADTCENIPDQAVPITIEICPSDAEILKTADKTDLCIYDTITFTLTVRQLEGVLSNVQIIDNFDYSKLQLISASGIIDGVTYYGKRDVKHNKVYFDIPQFPLVEKPNIVNYPFTIVARVLQSGATDNTATMSWKGVGVTAKHAPAVGHEDDAKHSYTVSEP